MVWCALRYALIGSLLTWRIGRPLIGMNAELYAREAALRFALVRVNESAESIALCGGEGDERRQLNDNLARVISTMRGLTGALSRLTWITSGYGWIAIIVPILVAAPGYFHGGLTIGGLMMVVGAFNQVQASLRWFVDQFPSIADWRATLRRVSAFKAAVDKARPHRRGGRNHRAQTASARAFGIRRRQCAAFGRPRRDFRGDGRDQAGRTRVDCRRIRRRQEHAVPRACRPVALGERDDPFARSRRA